MKRRLVYLLVGAIVLAGAVAAAAYFRPWEQAAQTDEVVRTATVRRGTMLAVVSASGSVEPEARAALSFETPGRVESVNVEMGDAVAADDILAEIDTRQLELQVRQAQSSLALAEAQLGQLLSGPRPADIAATAANLRVAQAQLAAAEARRSQTLAGTGAAQIAAAEARLASALLQRKPAQDAHDRTVHGDATDEAKEKARYDLYVASKAADAAQAQLDDLLAGVGRNQIRASEAGVSGAAAQVEAARAQLDLVESGATEQQIADTEAQVAQAEAALRLAERALESAALRAPFDGVVAHAVVKVGDLASPGAPVLSVLDLSKVHVSVSVDEIDVGLLSEGQSATVELDALPGLQLEGTIERIAPVAVFEAGVVFYAVDIGLDTGEAPVRADMSATATIVVEELVDVLQIPTWIVRVDRATGQTYVHRQKGETFERVDVDLGLRHEGVAEVVDGLAEGDVLVWVEESGPFGLGGA